MAVFLVSTVRRRCPPNEPSGYLYAVDPHTKTVIQRSTIIEPLFRDLDDNPRGGMRGSKGISIRPDQLALANFSMIFRYDPQWNLLGTITHPSCAGIHDILWDGDQLWVAAARGDLLMRFNVNGDLLDFDYLRRPSPLLDELKWRPPELLTTEHIRKGLLDLRHPLNVDKETYDRAHLNSMCLLGSGDCLVSLGFLFNDRYASLLRLKINLIRLGIWPLLVKANRLVRKSLGGKQKNMDQSLVVKPAKARSAIVRFSPDGQHQLILMLEGITAPSHSLLAMHDDTAIYLNTTNGCVLHVNPANGEILSQTQVTSEGFLRGVTRLNDHTLLIGSRTELITFDLNACQVTQRMNITGDSNEAVYDIKELPEHYSLPPQSLAESFMRQTGHPDPSYLI